MRVLAAMSGGVDSAVAAARAVDAGHEVVGVHLALSAKPGTLRTGSRGCCTLEDSRDARRAADVLGIPFYVWDFAEQFKAAVVDNFVEEYAAGRTPNPCLRCNEEIKFAALLDKALGLGFDAVATGHYARLSTVDGRPELRRSADEDKDQSYVLASLRPDQLAHAIFPLGDTVKDRVRLEAADRGLQVAEKPDSHDICFIPDGNTQAFLGAKIGVRPGALVNDETGEVLGEHRGVHEFTVGQRKGLGIDRSLLDGTPKYVIGLEPATGTVRVGSARDLQVTAITATDPVWPSGVPIDGPTECHVQVRAHGSVVPCVAELVGDSLEISLREPLSGVAPGQAAVLYRADAAGDIVLGSATIAATGS
ncbi:tRNA 2-thiouridine(34) synthase MnmA [Pseudonocardiaceae bacterium YIM PH 21723]|nr:tRNA 2-thiouridine(34) synthase MnmA [Pseudonocardiaceae bacterium YIM PH 21723]